MAIERRLCLQRMPHYPGHYVTHALADLLSITVHGMRSGRGRKCAVQEQDMVWVSVPRWVTSIIYNLRGRIPVCPGVDLWNRNETGEGETRQSYPHLPVELSIWSDASDTPTTQDKDAVVHGSLWVWGRGWGVHLASPSQPAGPGVAGQT